MKNIRIGNDIVVTWAILRGGAPFSLEGKDVTIYLKSPFKKEKVEDFSITGHRVSWTFYGKTTRRWRYPFTKDVSTMRWKILRSRC